jgi:hypothetical protein
MHCLSKCQESVHCEHMKLHNCTMHGNSFVVFFEDKLGLVGLSINSLIILPPPSAMNYHVYCIVTSVQPSIHLTTTSSSINPSSFLIFLSPSPFLSLLDTFFICTTDDDYDSGREIAAENPASEEEDESSEIEAAAEAFVLSSLSPASSDTLDAYCDLH